MDSKDQYIISLFQQYLIECGVEHNPKFMRVSGLLESKKSRLFEIAYDRFIIDFEQDGGIAPLPEWLQDEMYIASINILIDWENNNARFIENAKQYNEETA
jgi:hypothetical protein